MVDKVKILFLPWTKILPETVGGLNGPLKVGNSEMLFGFQAFVHTLRDKRGP